MYSVYSHNSKTDIDPSILVDEDGPVVNIALLQLIQGRFDPLLAHGELLDDGLDAVACREVEHLAVQVARGHEAALDVDAAFDQGHVGNFEVPQRHGQGVDGAAGVMTGRIRPHCGWADVVTRSRLMGRVTERDEAPRVATNSSVPRARACAFLASVPEKATRRHPIWAANWMARWPRTPTPMMPTVSVEWTPWSAVKVVAPPHCCHPH